MLAHATISEKEEEITLEMKLPKEMGGKDISISIKLLVPLTVWGGGSANNFVDDGVTEIFIEHCQAGNHSFAYTSEGDLFVDNFFVRRCEPSDDLRYVYGRFWANGKPCVLMPLTDEQKRRFYADEWQTSTQLAIKPCKLFVTPSSGWGGGERNAADGSIATHWAEGMTIVGFEHGSLFLHGMCYGKVAEDDEVRVEYGIVKINGKLRAPIQQQRTANGEHPGAAQPATQPADKGPAEVQPSTPTSKDAPR